MTAKERVLDVAAALDIVLGSLRPVGDEEVPLTDSMRRTTAGDVVAAMDLPPWTNSAMDGYACRAADIGGASPGAPVALPVAETIAAGAFPSRPLRPGEAMRIMTGAPVPEGADTVIRVEDTDGGTESVRITSARDAGANLRSRGEDIRVGQVAVRAGTLLTPGDIGMLAALGIARVRVRRRPRVAVLSSGDELVTIDDVDAAHAGRRVVSANNYSLAALVHEAGGAPVELGIVRDDVAALCAALERAADCDLILTSGGISVGAFDYTRVALVQLGANIAFWRIAMRPGYNTAFGTLRGTPWIGVPGNPVSALVATEVIARPAIRTLSGARAMMRRTTVVTAGERIKASSESTLYLRATLEPIPGKPPRARLTGAQGSAMLSSLVRADALLIILPGAAVEIGDTLNAIVLRDETAA